MKKVNLGFRFTGRILSFIRINSDSLIEKSIKDFKENNLNIQIFKILNKTLSLK